MRGLRTPVSDLRKSIFTEVAKLLMKQTVQT